jgi:hypothetical protein
VISKLLNNPASLMKCATLLCAVFISLTGIGSASAFAKSTTGDIVVLRTLDKVTAAIADLEIPIGEMAIYGTLEVTARKCLKRPPEETPETSSFLEIREKPEGEDELLLFMGWMFASSPGLNALEHPVYDVWVIDCKMSAPDTSAAKE